MLKLICFISALFSTAAFAQSLESFKIDLEIAQEEKKLSDLIEVIDVVNLELDIKNPVQWAEEIIETDKYFILLDAMRADKIHRFNKDGTSAGMIGKSAGGPGGFQIPYDMALSPSGDHLYVLDGEQLRINKYKLESRKFVESYTLPTPSDAFSVVSDTEFIIYNSAAEFGHYVYTYNLNSEVVQTFIPEEKIFSLGVDNHFVDLKNGLGRFFVGGVNTGKYIYTADKNGVYPQYMLDFGEYNLKAKDLEEASEGDRENPLVRITNKVGQLVHLAENEKHLVVSVRLNEESLLALVDKTCGAYNVFSKRRVIDDVMYSEDGIYRIYSVGDDKDYFYLFVMPGYVNQEILSDFGKNNPKVAAVFGSFDEANSNPLLLKVRLKI